MTAELACRADAIRARFRLLEGVRGSGWHDDDRNPTVPEKYLAPQRNGRSLASDNIVYFDDEFSIVIAGNDVQRVLLATSAHREALIAMGWENLSVDQLRVVKRIPSFKASSNGDNVPLLVVPRQLWNLLLQVLEAQCIGVSGAPLVPTGTDPNDAANYAAP